MPSVKARLMAEMPVIVQYTQHICHYDDLKNS